MDTRSKEGERKVSFFKYYQYDNVRNEHVVGIVVADSAKEAKEKVEKHYEHAYQKGFTKEAGRLRKSDSALMVAKKFTMVGKII